MCPAAAIDLGSNAMRMLVASADTEGNLCVLENHREAIRLGSEVFNEGEVSAASVQRLVSAFDRFRVIAERLAVRDIRAVATSALREARNGAEVIREIKRQSNVSIDLIPGEEEARLVHLAVASKISLKSQVVLLVDIGGGSVEISVVAKEQIVISESLKMGAVRLLNFLESRERGHKLFARLVQDYVSGMRRQIKREIGDRKITMCIGTGGNIDELGELRVSLLGKKDSSIITHKELDTIFERLRDLSVEERVNKLGMRPDRADVIIPAIVILQNVLRHADVDELQIPHIGLKEGVLLDIFARRSGRGSVDTAKQAITYAIEIGRKFQFDESHGRKVAELSSQIFEQTQELHKLDKGWRLILEISSFLHDIGKFISQHDHHKHAYYLISETPMVGLNLRQRQLTALVARYHRKSAPKNDHSGYSELSPEERSVVRKLSAILRIADALDCEHRGCVKRIALHHNKGELIFSAKSSGDIPLESWAFHRKSKCFEDEFGVKCILDE